eukprot:3954504-Pyramimonas_sp.AAC.2
MAVLHALRQKLTGTRRILDIASLDHLSGPLLCHVVFDELAWGQVREAVAAQSLAEAAEQHGRILQEGGAQKEEEGVERYGGAGDDDRGGGAAALR